MFATLRRSAIALGALAVLSFASGRADAGMLITFQNAGQVRVYFQNGNSVAISNINFGNFTGGSLATSITNRPGAATGQISSTFNIAKWSPAAAGEVSTMLVQAWNDGGAVFNALTGPLNPTIAADAAIIASITALGLGPYTLPAPSPYFVTSDVNAPGAGAVPLLVQNGTIINGLSPVNSLVDAASSSKENSVTEGRGGPSPYTLEQRLTMTATTGTSIEIQSIALRSTVISQAVPEPSTLVGGGFAVLALAFARARTRKDRRVS